MSWTLDRPIEYNLDPPLDRMCHLMGMFRIIFLIYLRVHKVRIQVPGKRSEQEKMHVARRWVKV
jgi:hypothetical protein